MNKKILVFGSGISGVGACNLLTQVQKDVILYDGNQNLDREKLQAQFTAPERVEVILG